MARDPLTIHRDDLLELEDQLLDDGFGFLMTLLPRELFQVCGERIVIHESLIQQQQNQPEKERIAVAYVTTPDERVQILHPPAVDGDALEKNDFPPSSKRRKRDPHVELIPIGVAEIRALSEVSPLSWHHSPDRAAYVISPDWRNELVALVRYYLMIWATKNAYDAPLPQPHYPHLVAAFARLRTTQHYKNEEVPTDDEERGDDHVAFIKNEVEVDSRPLTLPRPSGQQESPIVRSANVKLEDNTSAHPEQDSSMSSYNPAAAELDQELDNAAKLPTPHQTPKQASLQLDVDMVDSAEVSTRATSVNSAELVAMDSLETDVAMSLETEALVRQSLPTPDTLMEEAVVDADPTLRDIQKKMGQSTLALLPSLSTCTFKKIHTKEKGFLSLRLLLGTFREDTSRPDLEGCEAWASFKMHDKNDRAAPRMHVHAFRAGTDKAVEDDLKIKDVLPDLRLGPAFNSIQGGDRAEELLLKALVKYFFIIAARDKVLGFDKHKMPFNGSFVDQLKIACKRLQMNDGSRDGQNQPRPFKRMKRSHNPTPRPSASLSDADDDAPAVRTRDARRSGRRTAHPSSAAVSESEDSLPAAVVPMVPQTLPRRLALGVRIVPLMEGPAVNEFLDPEADPADSDGDSGDEIPAPISMDTRAFLEKRYIFQKQVKNLGESVKYHKNRKESTIMGIRKVKGMLNKNVMAPADRAEAERGLAHRRMCETTIGTHLGMKEGALEGWKARMKQVNKDAVGIDPRVMEAWDVLYRV